MCPICLMDVDPAVDVTLDCGGNHVMHQGCVQGLANSLGGAVATNEQGPNGAMIDYIPLPRCPTCRQRFHLLPHTPDPNGLDPRPNNNPIATDPPRYYYDGTAMILSAAQVQQYVIDADADALQQVLDMDADENEDFPDYSSDEDDQDYQIVPDPDAGYRVCTQCNQLQVVEYDTGALYDADKHGIVGASQCVICALDIAADATNIRACMNCWAAWHENCLA